ncbi:MAG: hypothetical protein ABJN39_03475 [Sulfitobacter sp.]|uniref:hypothetical protein n=1 Tax=unclassified Sulfitobacter TaxID=196795 RepID=UPI002943BA1A|nr:hypothetical protein [Sulfitobacter sp. LC.270.F.C4]WOI14241.1 hypothetical protein R1T45_14200 [Sulfitobacter sp. LC.270.F.C4]
MTIFQTRNFKNSMAITAAAILLTPAAQAEIGLGVGVSAGGHGGADVGMGASVGRSDGVGAGVGASVGGDSGVNAGVGASVGGGDGVNADVGASVGGSHGVGAGAGVSVGGNGGSGSGGAGTGGQDPVPGTTAGRATGVADSSAISAKTINIATLIGAPVWSKDRILVGMIEEVAPGPNGKVDAVLRLSAALKTDKNIIRMRIAPRLSDRGVLRLGYSKQKFLQLFAS